jgi:hypothetical protein
MDDERVSCSAGGSSPRDGQHRWLRQELRLVKELLLTKALSTSVTDEYNFMQDEEEDRKNWLLNGNDNMHYDVDNQTKAGSHR